jgi:hypothetical protein
VVRVPEQESERPKTELVAEGGKLHLAAERCEGNSASRRRRLAQGDQ